ncbi:MAG: methyltransferase domain-containing protein [Myxococcales bacterium]|nr:methyltransferase domain-containing protein [Myxococcales bacterium]MDH3484072.1 methyltransferase domain-containing protein [Myxococcales bacterium]
MEIRSCCTPGSPTSDRSQGQAEAAPVPQEQIGALYDSLAPAYDVWAFATESKARKRALELARIQDGEAILEVAVGTGLMFEQVLRRNPHGKNMGIDLSEGMLAKAKERASKHAKVDYELSLGSALDLPFQSESIDLLINTYMFDLLSAEDTAEALGEFARVLRPGGRIVLVNMARGRTPMSRLYEHISRWSPRTLGGCRGVEVARKLPHHGFAVDETEYHQQCLFPSEIVTARKPE